MVAINQFHYENDFLSNFHPVTVIMDGVGYASVEHAYQAAKTLDLEKRWIFSLEANPNLTAGKAKTIGQNIALREDWAKVKVTVMRDLLLQKFDHNVLTKKLLATGEAFLEEGNWWHDTFWGVCYHKLDGRVCKKPEHEPTGGNHLGYMLMDLRTHFSRLKASPHRSLLL